MRRAGHIIALAAGLLATQAVALDTSPVPDNRPVRTVAAPTKPVLVPAPTQDGVGVYAPSPRPDTEISAPQVATAPAVVWSPRPAARPKGLSERAQTAVAQTRVAYGKVGGVCGSADIVGQPMSAIPGRIKGCGVDAPVKVTSVAGVRLSTPATIDCGTAQALRTWVAQVALPVVGRTGGGVAELDVAASYACRARNNQKGAKVSEHGRGRAIDISQIRLANGDTLNVLSDWNTRKKGKLLKQLHGSACGVFGTVLGPESDRFHKDHFHFDTARYRSGSYCR